MLGKGFFGSANLAQRRFPSTLEFAGDKTIVRIDAVELALGQRCSIALALKLTFRAAAQGLFDLLLRPAGSRQRIISSTSAGLRVTHRRNLAQKTVARNHSHRGPGRMVTSVLRVLQIR
ncbi:hypothetical protein [Mesorhizobium sp.]|uniref:hypothetical protein n=1 Tax=Mesorhizobium sp. TaxID=1871066 RepID=UPI00121B0080|nr:hypothetical protein [Mesorhizobium sp.]TIL29710.1 MAG: hypothetical protein E5Y82_33100 [Mesorhizobium sp.]